MFKTNADRVDYSEMLISPVGYKTKFAVGTSYSLDLETMISVSIALGLNEDIDSKLAESPICLLEALRKVNDKLLIFCEAGQIKVPATQNRLFPFLENSVVMVNARQNRSFHPKVWLVKYENDNADVIYRILVLSRNLTFDRSWDVAVCMDGINRKKTIVKNKALSDFLNYLASKMSTGDSKMNDKRKTLRKLIEEVMQVEFELDDKRFTGFDFIPLGIEDDYNKEYTELFNNYHELLVISPFLSKGIIRDLSLKQLANADKTLITRKSELHKLSKELLEDFETFTMKDDVIDGEDRISSDDEIKKQDIHAKLYLRTKYSDSELFLGSANASDSAFNGNIEFMLNLYAKRRYLNVQDVKNDLFGDDEKLSPFEKVSAFDYQLVETDKIKDDLQKAIKEFCKTKLSAKITEGYTATVKIQKLKAEFDFYLEPLMISKKEKVNEVVEFKNLLISQLSEFYVLTAKLFDQSLSRVIKIRTDGMPEDRDASIFNSIIANKEGFIQYVSFLLGDDYLLSFIEDGIKNAQGFNFLSANGVNAPVIYEKMLKVAASNPERLRDIKKVMEMISDKNIIPESFNNLYETFEKAVL